jgi:hypothetical protein
MKIASAVLTIILALAPSAVFAQPGPVALIAPYSEVTGNTIAFSWQSATDASWYQLWLGTPSAALVIEQWYTAEHAGCATGASCTVVMSPPISGGAFVWYIRGWGPSGYGAWSNPQLFTLKDPGVTWGRKLPDSRRFTLVLDNEAVLDNETGLVWQRETSPDLIAWNSAINVCGHVRTGGRRGWRVPQLSELLSLVDNSQYQPSLPSGHPFAPLGALPFFWTATAVPGNSELHYRVGFLSGDFAGSGISQKLWCVRGGASPAH